MTTKYHTVETVPKSNRKIVERFKIDCLITQTHEHSQSRLGTGTSIKRGGINLFVWAQTFT
jgi:hypothetical protein